MRFRRVLGYLPQDFGVYPRTTAQDMLDQIALLKGVRDGRERKELVDWTLHRVNLYEHRKKALSSFSGGMRQRFGIGQALLGLMQRIREYRQKIRQIRLNFRMPQSKELSRSYAYSPSICDPFCRAFADTGGVA